MKSNDQPRAGVSKRLLDLAHTDPEMHEIFDRFTHDNFES